MDGDTASLDARATSETRGIEEIPDLFSEEPRIFALHCR